MDMAGQVMRLRGLSNEDLQASLGALVGTGRKLTATVIAHLGEMEERRLHLLAGSRSMFDYCTVRLGMSEDEACRRIEVARLALRFPVLLERLASGAVSLSVAALLRNWLTETNYDALLAAVSGKTVGQAREVLAAWFPRPDVPDSIRKVPERTGVSSVATTITPQGAPALPEVPPAAEVETLEAPSERGEAAEELDQLHTARSAEPAATQATTLTSEPAPMGRTRGSRPFEPLSPGRFKVTFTASAELKQKLECARDLLRHAVPDGDIATIIDRAIDLLLEQTERRRFAKTSKLCTKDAPHSGQGRSPAAPPCSPNLNRNAPATTSSDPAPRATSARNGDSSLEPAPSNADAPSGSDTGLTDDTHRNNDARPNDDAPAINAAPMPDEASTRKARESRHIPHEVRRAVVERDGMGCSWQAPDGTRCNSRAWLEYDHIIPRACGGTDDPANIRAFCRAHNRLAAEQAYGKATITRIIARRRAARGQRATHGARAGGDIDRAPI